MDIQRTRKEKNFTQVDNGFINDPKLSFKAKGILLYLFSKPDDWRVVVSDVAKASKDGEKAVYSGLKELQKNGYAKVEQRRGKSGMFMGSVWVVFEVKQDTTVCLKSASRKQGCLIIKKENNIPEGEIVKRGEHEVETTTPHLEGKLPKLTYTPQQRRQPNRLMYYNFHKRLQNQILSDWNTTT